jgi:hypothetical protein
VSTGAVEARLHRGKLALRTSPSTRRSASAVPAAFPPTTPSRP